MTIHSDLRHASAISADGAFRYNDEIDLDHSGVESRSGSDIAKRVFDSGFAIFALLFFAPFIVLIATAILITDGQPIFFAHTRIGRHGRPFRCLKFRTMVRDADARLEDILTNDPEARMQWQANQKLDDDPRISCLGEFFRKTSLDEIPQFWNVLRGEMSVVGPRPIVADEARHYGEHYADYLSVRPGITGQWQVSGRSNTTYPERVRMDVDYVANRSFRNDLVIVARTVKVMLFGEGAA